MNGLNTDNDGETGQPRRSIALFGKSYSLPQSRIARLVIGCLLIIGGILGFLPVLGFWMVPLGVLVLSHDLGSVRRFRRKFMLWFTRWRNRGKESSK